MHGRGRSIWLISRQGRIGGLDCKLRGETGFDFCFRQVKQDEVAYGAEGDSATPDEVLAV